jgi:hypothetical protein
VVIPFCLLGFIFAYASLSAGLQSIEIQKRWTVVVARVHSRSVKEAFPRPDQANPTWRPSVVYEYEIGGRKYQCDHVNIRWNEGYIDPAPSEDAIQPYLPGRDVPAYVNPDDATDAVLDATPMVSWIMMFSGWGFASVALLFGFSAYSQSPKRRTPGLLLLGFLWIFFSAIGLACAGISGSTPMGVWIATVLHGLVGVALAARQLRPLARGGRSR